MVMKKGIILLLGVIALTSCESAEEKAFKKSIEDRIAINEKMIDYCSARADSAYPYALEAIKNGDLYSTAEIIYQVNRDAVKDYKLQIEEDKKYLYK